MALEHAILVSLAEKSASGYDLARRFDASIGHFWTASHQQIYKVLGRMESDKWVAAHLVAQDGRPDKKVYAITDDGRDELMRWSSKPTPHEKLPQRFRRQAPRRCTWRSRRGARRTYEHAAQAHARSWRTTRPATRSTIPIRRPSARTSSAPSWRCAAASCRSRPAIEWCDEILQAFGAAER